MPSYRMRILRNDGLIVYDSGGGAARINTTVIDKPSPGAWSYTLQIIGINTGDPNYKVHSNTIAGIKLGR